MTKQEHDAIQAELEALKDDDGLVHAEDVVEFAKKHKDSQLHRQFDWNIKKAAEAHWLAQARQVIRLMVVVITEDRPATRAYVSLPTDRINHGGYREFKDVVTDDSRRAELIEDVLQRLQALKRKYALLQELSQVWASLDAATEKHKKRKRANAGAA